MLYHRTERTKQSFFFLGCISALFNQEKAGNEKVVSISRQLSKAVRCVTEYNSLCRSFKEGKISFFKKERNYNLKNTAGSKIYIATTLKKQNYSPMEMAAFNHSV